jgi:hypothetical protein
MASATDVFFTVALPIVPYSVMVALGKISISLHLSPKGVPVHVRHVEMALQVVSTCGQKPSVDSELQARYG